MVQVAAPMLGVMALAMMVLILTTAKMYDPWASISERKKSEILYLAALVVLMVMGVWMESVIFNGLLFEVLS